MGARRSADSAVARPGAGAPVRMGGRGPGGAGARGEQGEVGRGRTMGGHAQVMLRNSLLRFFQTPTGLADGFGRGSGPTAGSTGTGPEETHRFTPGAGLVREGSRTPPAWVPGSALRRTRRCRCDPGGDMGPGAGPVSRVRTRGACVLCFGRRPVAGGRPGAARGHRRGSALSAMHAAGVRTGERERPGLAWRPPRHSRVPPDDAWSAPSSGGATRGSRRRHAAAGCAAWDRSAWWAPRGHGAWRAP